MRDWDIRFLFHFIRRPRMYTGSLKENDYKSVDSFLIAYELGSMGECRFREQFTKKIKDKYGDQISNDGLAKLLREASKKGKREIGEFFFNESMEILIAESDNKNQSKFINLGRRQLIQLLEQLPKEININWVSNFSKEIIELKAWAGKNLTNEEITNSERLIGEIRQLIKRDVMKLVAVPENINKQKEELLNSLNKYL